MYMPPSNGGDFTPPPEGTHRAVCYRVIDLGTQQVDWKGQIKHQRKVMLSWELVDELMEDGQPFSVHQRYTLSSSEKSRLRQDLEAWRGVKFTEADFGPGGFKIENVLGAACLLGVIHEEKNDRTYANISSIMKLPKGMDKPEPVNLLVYFSLDPKEFMQGVFDGLSEGLKDVIKKSPEYSEAVMGPQVNDAPPPPNGDDPWDQEVPF